MSGVMSSANLTPYREPSVIATLENERDVALARLAKLEGQVLVQENGYKDIRELATAVTVVVFVTLIATAVTYGILQLFRDRVQVALAWFAGSLVLLAVLRRLLGRRWAW